MQSLQTIEVPPGGCRVNTRRAKRYWVGFGNTGKDAEIQASLNAKRDGYHFERDPLSGGETPARRGHQWVAILQEM